MKKQLNRVSILGCGWLGLPLAEYLVTNGYQVNGSTTTPEKLEVLRQKNIKPFLIDLRNSDATRDLVEFLRADCLVVSFPPRLRAGQEANYLPQINVLATALRQSPVKLVLFISSTSVYREVNSVIIEANDSDVLITESALYEAEIILQKNLPHKTIILRFGGLVGGERHPGRFLAGKTEVPQPNAPVNLLHLDDCLAICARIIAGPVHNEIYNAVADKHPTRQEFYTAAAKALQLLPPQFASQTNPCFKIISNEKIKAALSYEFIHPDPMFFI